MSMQNEGAYITMTYDIIDRKLPQGWTETKNIYLDANSCLTSESTPPPSKNQLTIQSRPLKPDVEGKIIYRMGHLHDSSTEFDIRVSRSTSLCKNPAAYFESVPRNCNG
jgi:hypothetical protein